MKSRPIAVTLYLVLVTVLQSAGQYYVGGAGMVNAGYMYTPELSSSLNSIASNRMRFQRGYTIVGMEVNYRNARRVIVASGYMGTQEAKLLDNKFVEPFIWKAHAGFGWIVSHNKSFALYPVLGVGAMHSSLIYHDRQAHEIHSTITSPSLDVGAHFDYLLMNADTTEKFVSVAIVSMRMNYTYGVSGSNLQGWSITLSFGGVAFMKQHP